MVLEKNPATNTTGFRNDSRIKKKNRLSFGAFVPLNSLCIIWLKQILFENKSTDLQHYTTMIRTTTAYLLCCAP